MGGLIVRHCRDEAELEELYAAIGRQFGGGWNGSDRRLDEPRRRFGADQELMLALVDGSVIRGGVIAFGDDVVTVRALGIDAELRGHGYGRRLLELVEARALVRGARAIILGAAEDAGGFCEENGLPREAHEAGEAVAASRCCPFPACRSAAATLEHVPSGIPVS